MNFPELARAVQIAQRAGQRKAIAYGNIGRFGLPNSGS